MAQRSKSLGAPSRKAILGTAREKMPQVQVLGCRLGRCFCAMHRGVHRTPAPCRLDHRLAVTERLLLFLFLRAKQARLLWALSPKRVLWTMRRGENGAAVKIARRSKPKSDFGHRKREDAAGVNRFINE